MVYPNIPDIDFSLDLGLNQTVSKAVEPVHQLLKILLLNLHEISLNRFFEILIQQMKNLIFLQDLLQSNHMMASDAPQYLADYLSLLELLLIISNFNILHERELALSLLIKWIFSLFKLVDYLDHVSFLYFKDLLYIVYTN